MTTHRSTTLLVAALAAAFFSAAIAQTQSDDKSRMPAQKGMAQESQTQPSTDQTDKMKGDQSGQMKGHSDQAKAARADRKADTGKSANDHSAMAGEEAKTGKKRAAMAEHSAKTGKSGGEQTAMAGHKTKTSMGHGARPRQGEEAANPDENAYRQALRDCAKQSDQNQRDSCLDSAIEKFHRNA